MITKICHMTSAHPSEDVRIFHKECVSLAQAGYEVYLVQRGESYDKNGVHIVGVGEIPEGRIKRMTVGAKKTYRAAVALNCDVYHIHDPELLPYGLKLKRKGKKVIFDSHENTADAILEKHYLPFAFRKLICKAYTAYQKKAISQFDAVITVTPSLTRVFKAFTPNVIEVRNYPVLNSESALEMSTKSENRIVFAGGVSEQWNHHTLIKAMEKVPDCTYCLCGPCAKEYLESLERMPAWKQVDYLGKIPHSKVAEELSKSGIGVALLQPGMNTDGMNGTMGNTKIFEEMMAGLPIVCTDFVLWKEFVDKYHCGICVRPDDPDEISEAVCYLINHPDEARRMGENGKTAVREEFCWEKGKSALLNLYRDLLSSGGQVK